MATYYRPNLTAEQLEILVGLLKTELAGVQWNEPGFDALYRLVLKLQDCKPIST